MRKRYPESLKQRFALWVAQGKRVSAWCKKQRVPQGTCYEWLKRDDVQRLIDEHRRAATDRAVDVLASELDEAIQKIHRPSRHGESPRGRLARSRDVIHRLLFVPDRDLLQAEVRRIRSRMAAPGRREGLSARWGSQGPG